jgi:glutaconyl-CoA/methylmalonyl-CoA decarboxylase subunit gamma
VRFKIRVDGTEREVEMAADGTLVLDGETFQTNVSSTAGGHRTVQVGETSYEVRIVGDDEKTGPATPDGAASDGAASAAYVLEIAGERVPVTVSNVTKGGPSAEAPAGTPSLSAAGGGGVARQTGDGAEAPAEAPEVAREGIRAPVPGKIVDVFVKVGDTVDEGDLVLILEAMKMENELHATKKAIVVAVLVKKGDQAERGQLLVAFE